MIADPATAPPRDDLPFLRRRSRPRTPQPAAAPRPPAAPPSGGIDYTHAGRRGAPPPAAKAQPASPQPTTSGLNYTHPPRRTPEAAAASQPPPPSAAPARPSSSLDLSDTPAPPAPSSPTARPAGPSSSLDLSDAPAPAPAAARPTRPAPSLHRDARLHGRDRHLLQRNAPTVTLTRLQSGIGQLAIEAVCSPEVGDLRLGAVYQLRSGGSSTVQLVGGRRFAPPSSRRPVIVASRDEGYDRVSVDLRQIRDVERIVIYAFSESRTTLTWGGTLVLTTYGGGRVEVPLEALYAGAVAVLVSLYNLDGELVVRAEMETIGGDVREAARSYGFDRITWRDDRNPVD